MVTSLVPNIESGPTYDAQAVPDATDWDIALGVAAGVVSGCVVAPTSPLAYAVSVSAGIVNMGGPSYPVAANPSLAPFAPNTTDRKDVVLVGLNGVPYFKTGTPCGVAGWTRTSPFLPPVKPSPDAGTVVLAEVYIRGNVIANLTANEIVSKGVPSNWLDKGSAVFNVKAYGAAGNGIADDTAAIAAAIAAASAVGAGACVLFPAGSYLLSSTLTVNAPIDFLGYGAQILATNGTFNLFTLQLGASLATISGLTFIGGAVDNTTTQFGIFTLLGNVPTGVTVQNCIFGSTGSIAPNNGIKCDTAANDWLVQGCQFINLWGAISGTGYGVLLGAALRTRVIANRFTGTTGRGRHGVYVSAGSSYCEVGHNVIVGHGGDGIAIFSSGIEAACAYNHVHDNMVVGCSSLANTDSGGIECDGIVSYNSIVDNTIISSTVNGITVTDGGSSGNNLGTVVAGNRVFLSGSQGIAVLGAQSAVVMNNVVYNASQTSSGVTDGIHLSSSGSFGTQLANANLFIGNKSYGSMQRWAFRIDSTSPTPTNTTISGNFWGTGTSGTFTLNSIAAALSGNTDDVELPQAQAVLAMDAGLAAASANTVLTISGVPPGRYEVAAILTISGVSVPGAIDVFLGGTAVFTPASLGIGDYAAATVPTGISFTGVITVTAFGTVTLVAYPATGTIGATAKAGSIAGSGLTTGLTSLQLVRVG